MGGYYTAIAVMCVLGPMLQAVFIYSEYKHNMFAALFLKGAASLIFVAVGYIGYYLCGKTDVARLILFGLILGAAGDILLNVRYLTASRKKFFFIIGTVAFFSGHILYLAALFVVSGNILIPLAAGAVLTLTAGIVMWIKTVPPTHFKLLGGLYIAAVVLMASVAVSNALVVCDTWRVLFAVGAVLFMVSDMILILNTFGKEPKMFWSGVCLSLYYPGQLLIALSVGFLC